MKLSHEKAVKNRSNLEFPMLLIVKDMQQRLVFLHKYPPLDINNAIEIQQGLMLSIQLCVQSKCDNSLFLCVIANDRKMLQKKAKEVWK